MDRVHSADTHIPTVADLSGSFVGELVAVEPLSIDHEPGLALAAEDQQVFTDDAWPNVKALLERRRRAHRA